MDDDDNAPLLSEQERDLALKRPKTTDVEGMEMGGDFFVSAQYGGGRNRVSSILQKAKPANVLTEQELKAMAHARKDTGVLAVIGIPPMRHHVDDYKTENDASEDIDNNSYDDMKNDEILQPLISSQQQLQPPLSNVPETTDEDENSSSEEDKDANKDNKQKIKKKKKKTTFSG